MSSLNARQQGINNIKLLSVLTVNFRRHERPATRAIYRLQTVQVYIRRKPEEVQATRSITTRLHWYQCTPCGDLAGEYDTVRSGNQYKVQVPQRLVYTFVNRHHGLRQRDTVDSPTAVGIKREFWNLNLLAQPVHTFCSTHG